jgi:hypothetical protein
MTYGDVELLYKEAEALRKDVHNKYHLVIAGEYIIMGVSQDYLITNIQMLMQVTSLIEKYFVKIQMKPLEINSDEIKIYKDLIKAIKLVLP